MSSAGRAPSKIQRVARCLLKGPCNRFELERQAHDHVPASTIQDLRAKGLVIHSKIVEVAGFAGAIARIAEYHLDPQSRELAAAIVARPPRGGSCADT